MGRCVAGILAVFMLLSCDRAPQPAPPPAAPPPTATKPAAQKAQLGQLRCDFTVVIPLLPKRPTHISVDPYSNLYFVQEAPDGNDGVSVLGSGEISTATALSSRAILAELNAKGTGNIQSIAAGNDGNVYFFFTGGNSRDTIACFGRLEPRSKRVRILASQTELAAASQMGASLALARGTVVAAGQSVWLWLAHSDMSVLFNLRPRDFPENGEIGLPKPTSTRSADGTLRMTRDDLKLSPGPADSMLLLDLYSAAIWRIDPTGAADVVHSIVGLPRLMTRRAPNSLGDVAFFAAPSEPIEPRVEERVAPVDIDTHYPSILVLRDGEITPIPRDDLHSESAFQVFTMELEQMLYEPGRDTWIGFDAASGQIVRMKFSPKTSR